MNTRNPLSWGLLMITTIFYLDITLGSSSDRLQEGDVTTANDENMCKWSHRAHPRDKRKYQMLANGVWVDMPCPGKRLVWDQEYCRCEYPKQEPCLTRLASFEAGGGIERYTNGKWEEVDCPVDGEEDGSFWSSEECRCVSTSKHQANGVSQCDVMLNISFHEPISDTAKGSFVSVSSDSDFSVKKVDGAIGEWAADIRRASIQVHYFAGNVWSERVQIFLSFRAADDSSNTFQSILTNSCEQPWTGTTEPTVSVSYRPNDSMLRLLLTTTNTGYLDCRITQEPLGWHSVAILYHEDGLQIFVDGFHCANATSRYFYGPVGINQCPLTLASDPLGKNTPFTGLLDEVLITRYCRME